MNCETEGSLKKDFYIERFPDAPFAGYEVHYVECSNCKKVHLLYNRRAGSGKTYPINEKPLYYKEGTITVKQ